MTFIALSITALAQKAYTVTIKGTAAFAAGEQIRLIGFEDLVTYRSKVMATDEIDAKGRFLMTCDISQPTLIQMAIRTSRAEFYIEPGRTYDFTVDMDPELFNQLDPMNYGGFLQIRNIDTTLTEDINYKINKFEYVLDNAIDTYSPNIIGDISPADFDSIQKTLKKQFQIQYSPTSFYKSYIFYTLGSLERIVLIKNQDSLYYKYLDNEYLLYDNPAYMNFFYEFYAEYLTTSPKIDQKELLKCINEVGLYRPLFNLVGQDPNLVNEKIRELAIIENLSALYENKRFSRKNIEAILQEIATTTHFTEHKLIAQNALAELHQFVDSHKVDFSQMKKVNGADFNIEDYKGKWVYVQIFNTDCMDCIREMMIIKELHEKYKDSVAFVSLSIDFNFGHFIQFKEHFPQFNWDFAHFNQRYDWLDALQVTTLPDNLLFSPDGELSQRNAPDITTKLPLFLLRLFREVDENDIPLNRNRQ